MFTSIKASDEQITMAAQAGLALQSLGYVASLYIDNKHGRLIMYGSLLDAFESKCIFKGVECFQPLLFPGK